MSYPNSKFTGFPFEDDFDDRHHSFRSQLDEIAQRHPEFAQHLHFGEFPSRAGRRQRRDSDERPPRQQHQQQQQQQQPFRSRFEGFPFEDEPDRYFYRQRQEEDPEEERRRPAEEAAKKNIQQSNTVDLGKNQEPPVDDSRGQRSMSAPPEQKRFVSSINIPIHTDGMGAKPSQPQPPQQQQHQGEGSQKPFERVIPIHVEGRDEPVMPKNANFVPTEQPKSEKLFGKNPSHFTQFLNKEEPSRATPEPTEVVSAPPQLEEIQKIQKDVSELMNQVEKFNGKPKDKEYLFLDEMLTRNLIKLDNIETEGKDNVRQARKEAIKCIEGCIGILEAKANANLEAEKQTQEVAQPEVAPQQDVLEVSGTSRSGTVVETQPECKPEVAPAGEPQNQAEPVPMEVATVNPEEAAPKKVEEVPKEPQIGEAPESEEAPKSGEEAKPKPEDKTDKKKTVKKKEKSEKK